MVIHISADAPGNRQLGKSHPCACILPVPVVPSQASKARKENSYTYKKTWKMTQSPQTPNSYLSHLTVLPNVLGAAKY